MIIIGVIFENDCPLEKRIPIWNIVFGSVGLGFMIVNCYINKSVFILFLNKINKNISLKTTFQSTSNLNGGSSSVIAIWLSSLMFVFEIIWFILGIMTYLKEILLHIIWFFQGCIWVYNVKKVATFNPNDSNYCHYDLIALSFWIINGLFAYLFLGLSLQCCRCLLGCSIAEDVDDLVITV